jgi:SMODS-associating 4TM effector domain
MGRQMSKPEPTLTEIAKTQNDATSQGFQLAKAYYYTCSKWLYFGGASLTLTLALVAPFVLLFWPTAGPALGAIAGLWIFVSRLVLDPFRRGYQLNGARAQEAFDCRVLGLTWNEALTRPLPPEDINGAKRRAARWKKRVEQASNWYAASDLSLNWPKSVLACQRSNAVWACRQHRSYGWVVAAAAIVWFVVGLVVAAFDDTTLGAYLVTILLPSMPAFLDASELSKSHQTAAIDRELVRDRVDELLKSGSGSRQDLREIQDQLFRLRRDAPQVPEWFYRIIRPGYEEDMRHAVTQLIDQSGTEAAS